jgi:hypothetical protein
MRSRSLCRPARPCRRARPVLELLEERNLLAAPPGSPSYPLTPQDNTPAVATTNMTTAASEPDEYTNQNAASPSADQSQAAKTSGEVYEWMNSRRTTSTTNATSSTQATPDNRAVGETVLAARRITEPGTAAAGPGVAAAPLPLPGNEILALPVPSPVLVAATGSGLAEVAPPAPTPAAEAGPDGTPAELAGWGEETLLAAAPRGDESAAARAVRLADLAPQLGTVLAGNLTRPADVADLGRRVSDFFGQLRAADGAESEAGSPLGLAPWLVAVGAATVAWEIARRRLRRPAALGLSPTDLSESLTWVRRPGHPTLSTEEL